MHRSDSQRIAELYEDAVELVRRQKPRIALLKLLDLLVLDPGHEDALRATAKLTALLGDRETTQVLERVLETPEDVRALYELGYRFVTAGRPDVGAVFLSRCASQVPENELVQYELGYALFSARRYQDANTVLEAVIAAGELSPSEQIDALLLLSESQVYVNRLEAAKESLDGTRSAVPSAQQLERADALALLLGRASTLPDLAAADLRGWHYVQHGSILLRLVRAEEVKGARGGRVLEASPGYAFTAAMLQLGALLSRRLGLDYDDVFAASDLSVPLAVVVARSLGTEVHPFDPDQSERGLLVAKEPGELRACQQRLADHGDLDIFCLCLDWTRSQPFVPDMVGFFSRHSYLPWEERHRVSQDPAGVITGIREPKPTGNLTEATENLLAVADALDLEHELKALEHFYRPRREQLLIGQPDRYPRRRLFTAHSPVVTDDRIFAS